MKTYPDSPVLVYALTNAVTGAIGDAQDRGVSHAHPHRGVDASGSGIESDRQYLLRDEKDQ